MAKAKKPAAGPALADLKHKINYAVACEMVDKFQKARKKAITARVNGAVMPPEMPDVPISFTFNKKGINLLLKKMGCAGIRMYPAINATGQITLVLVAVDAEGNNITPGVHKISKEAKKAVKSHMKALAKQDSTGPAPMMMMSLSSTTGMSDDDALDESQVNPPFQSQTTP